jgi:hypothetical protein
MTDRLKPEEIRPYLEQAGWDFELPIYFSMPPSKENLDLLVKYKPAVAAFRLFMRDVYAHPDGDPDYTWEDTDFASLSVGFLVALSVPPSDAFGLSPFMRYNLQDFDLDPEINPKTTKPETTNAL